MPKMKSHKGSAKRFKKTASGKFKRAHAFHTHILTKKTAKRKRKLRKGTFVDVTLFKMLRKMLPYA
jgi:large subunit ribosomal protein L35